MQRFISANCCRVRVRVRPTCERCGARECEPDPWVGAGGGVGVWVGVWVWVWVGVGLGDGDGFGFSLNEIDGFLELGLG